VSERLATLTAVLPLSPVHGHVVPELLQSLDAHTAQVALIRGRGVHLHVHADVGPGGALFAAVITRERLCLAMLVTPG